MMGKITHDDLCKAAQEVLIKKFGCHFAVIELTTWAGEIPDAIGWRQDVSVLIEAKASRADFLRDKMKFHKQRSVGMGCHRFYICPPDIIKVEDLPEGWGLIYYNGKRNKIIHSHCHSEIGTWQSDGTVRNKRNVFDSYKNRNKKDNNAELTYLCSVVRRYANGCEYVKSKVLTDGKFVPFKQNQKAKQALNNKE